MQYRHVPGSRGEAFFFLIRRSIPRGNRYRQQSRRRIQVSQRGLVLVVGCVARLTGEVVGIALGGTGSGGCNLAGPRGIVVSRLNIGRCASVHAGGRNQHRDGQESIHPAANHGSGDKLADCLIGSIRPQASAGDYPCVGLSDAFGCGVGEEVGDALAVAADPASGAGLAVAVGAPLYVEFAAAPSLEAAVIGETWSGEAFGGTSETIRTRSWPL
jgi:hypothetical protein